MTFMIFLIASFGSQEKRQTKLVAMALCAQLVLLFPSSGKAASLTIDAWRSQESMVRVLAENDAPLSYRQAKQLESSLPAEATSTDRAAIENLLARIEIYLAQTDSASAHTEKALEIATSNGDRIGQIEAQLNIALNSVNQGRIDALINSTTRAISLLDGINRPDLLIEALLRTSTMYRYIGQVDESITMSMQAMEVARNSNNSLALAYAHQGLGVSYEESDHKDKAIGHFKLMAQFAKKANSKLLEAYALTSLARLNASLGIREDDNQIKDAISLFRTAGAPFGLAHGLFSWAEIMRGRKQLPAALRGYTEAISIYERYPNKIGLWSAYQARSIAYQANGNATEALADAEAANRIAQELGLSGYRSNSAQRLSELAASTGDYRRAFQLAHDSISLNNQANFQKISTRIIELGQRYETESKRRQIEELTRKTEQQSVQQRWLWTVLVGSMLMLAGSTYFYLRLRRSHRLQEQANSQLYQSRQELEQQTNILESILNSIGDGVTVVDERGDLVLANPAARKITAELHGSLLPDMETSELPAQIVGFHQKNRPMARAIRGESCNREELFIQTEAIPDGIWFSVTARPLIGKSGNIEGGVAVFSDITAHKHAAELLRKSEREFRTLAENSPDVIVRYDLELNRVYTNPAYKLTTGMPVGEAMNSGTSQDWKNCLNLSLDEYQTAIKEVLRTGAPAELYMEWKRPDNEIRSYTINVVPEKGPNEEVIGALAIGHDITALKQAERRLEESYAMLQELAAYRETAREEERARIARELHDELGQLLTALRLGVSTLRMQFGAANPLLAERIGALTELADKTLQGMRDVATLLRPPALDMGVVAALDWLVGEFSRHTGVVCEFDAPRNKVVLDEARSIAVFRLVQESLTNVARHASAGNVLVSLREGDDGGYWLEIKDDGRGFDPKKVKGRHFGLAGLRERGALIGGDVLIDSTPGAGTSIRVHIPLN